MGLSLTNGHVERIPRSPADLTPDRLTEALQARHPGCQVTNTRWAPIVGERGIAGNLFRIHLEGVGTDRPASLILKLPPADPGARAQLGAMGFFEREVAFYQTLRDRTPVDAARCYLAEFDPDTGDAALLLEDLGRERNGSSVAGSTVEEVTAELVALARMHAFWWQDPEVGNQAWARLPSMLAPDAVAEVFERAWPTFLRRLSIPIDDTITQMHGWISRTLHEASTTLFEAGPRTLVHNDVQADNLFFPRDPERPVVFVDWQMVTFARCVVDVAYAIRGGLAPEVRHQAEPVLIQIYHQALVEAGVTDYQIDRCLADYELATVLAPARLASAVGMHPALAAHPGAAWDTLFPRFAPS